MPHITFIHGISNQPRDVQEHWKEALRQGGLDVDSAGITSSMVYWSDVMYADPPAERRFGSGGPFVGESGLENQSDDLDASWRDDLDAEGLKLVQQLADRMGYDSDTLAEQPEPQEARPGEYGAVPIPAAVEKWLMNRYLRDVHHYLFNVRHSPRPGDEYRVQDHIRQLFVDQLTTDAETNSGCHVVLSHSMGTVISYDCLRNVPACPGIDGYTTVGSPLGISEVQDRLQGYSAVDGFPHEKVDGDWVNIYDRLDPVSLDARLANDYLHNGARLVSDVRVSNEGLWRHTAEEYLAQPRVCEILTEMLQ